MNGAQCIKYLVWRILTFDLATAQVRLKTKTKNKIHKPVEKVCPCS